MKVIIVHRIVGIFAVLSISVYASDLGFVVQTARFLCAPMRWAVASRYQLTLPTQEQLEKIAELERMEQERTKNLDAPENSTTFPFSYFSEIQTSLNFAVAEAGNHYKNLTLLEKIFTDRPQQLEAHLTTLAQRYKEYSDTIRGDKK